MERGRVGPFAAAAFLGSFLLFTLELLVAKLLLPRFGGAAYVWTASSAVFQGLLLAGYLYSRGALARLGERYYAWHLALLASALLWLPVTVGAAADGPYPSLRLAGAVLLAVGVPFFVLSTTSPVLQDWLRRSGTEDGYFLYAASNLGALVGLVAYPIAIEPALTVRAQLRGWLLLYVAYAALHLPFRPTARAAAPRATAASTADERLVWTLLAAGPSAALLASTNLLTLDFAAVPLVWVVPLAIYLATFVLSFKRSPWYPKRLSLTLVFVLLAWLAAVMVTVLFSADVSERFHLVRRLWVLNKAFFYTAALFILCLICHRALALARPPDERSSDFYVWVGLGGWLGGLLVGLLLPAAARALPLPELDWLLAGLLSLAGLFRSERARRAHARLETGPSRPVVLALTFVGALGLFFYVWNSPLFRPGTVAALRNFYGYYRVGDEGGLRRFHHGNTLHGLQSLDPARQDEPLLYYHRGSPVGEALALVGPKAERVAAFGLGAGAVAAYARPGQRWDFYELDPDVIALARTHFTHLSRAKGTVRVLAGDARLKFAEDEGGLYDVLILDVFSSGAIPAHLLTREALELYVSRLAPEGVILVHITNRFLDLRGVLADLAADAGLSGAAKEGDPSSLKGEERYFSSWAALTPSARKAAELERRGWAPLSRFARRRRVWTDDYAPVWAALRS